MKKIFTTPLLVLIKIYQRLISPLLPDTCRFSPTCSNYAIQSLKKHSLLKALYFIFNRVFRCNPCSKGGFDPVP